jgi:hypothetical protein
VAKNDYDFGPHFSPVANHKSAPTVFPADELITSALIKLDKEIKLSRPLCSIHGKQRFLIHKAVILMELHVTTNLVPHSRPKLNERQMHSWRSHHGQAPRLHSKQYREILELYYEADDSGSVTGKQEVEMEWNEWDECNLHVLT